MVEIVVKEFMDEVAVSQLKAHYETLYDPGLADRQAEIPALAHAAKALIVRNRTRVAGVARDAFEAEPLTAEAGESSKGWRT